MNFENFYKNSYEQIYRFFYYKSVNKAYIEDLAHEVYIRFYNKYKDSDISEEEGKKIIYGFSKNVYREWVRKCVKEKSVEYIENFEYEDYELEEEVEEKEEFEMNTDHFEEEKDKQKKQLLDAIEKLNPTVKQVLKYRFLENMSRKEIAEKLGISQKDVHTYQKRGIKYLNKIINGPKNSS